MPDIKSVEIAQSTMARLETLKNEVTATYKALQNAQARANRDGAGAAVGVAIALGAHRAAAARFEREWADYRSICLVNWAKATR